MLVENRILHKFPERIIHLNELLKMPEFHIAANDIKCKLEIPTISKIENNVKNCDEKNVVQKPRLDSNSHNLILEQTHIPNNKNIIEALKILKPNVKELAEDVNDVKLWISLFKPKIEDGNNFGVGVQEEIIEVLDQVKTVVNSYLEQVSYYYKVRGNLIAKVCKYPYIEDYRRTVEEFDCKGYRYLTHSLCNICNTYKIMHDTIIKNIEKIKKPRSSNTDSLY
ncbi:proteasome activator complex subunit 3-like [Aphis craccivora]|uniref:Proteasome activator complex subunit 3-like n=1 Tax=Aphis craccivora TaxID=307492 RepID=A0A6G0YUU9_APHCR|nr:proteasome activator complex subunit 3-like [Aphis craccivora]